MSRSTPRWTQQFDSASDAAREAIAERAAGTRRRRGARPGAGPRAGRSSGDRPGDRDAERRRRAGSHRRAAGAVGCAAADAVGIRGVADAPLPGCLAARSRIASAGACWPQPRPAGSRRWRRSSNSCWRRISRVEEIVARWRGLRRDADVLREHAAANPAAASGSSARWPRSRRRSSSTSRCAPSRSRTTCGGCSSCAARSRRWSPRSS